MLASDLRVVERWLSGQGASVEDALQAAGIPMTALTKPRSRIPTAQVGALLKQLSSQYPAEDIGLALAQHHHIMDTHVLGITAISSETGLAALQRLCRYQALVSTHSPLQIIEEADSVTIAKNVVYEGMQNTSLRFFYSRFCSTAFAISLIFLATRLRSPYMEATRTACRPIAASLGPGSAFLLNAENWSCLENYWYSPFRRATLMSSPPMSRCSSPLSELSEKGTC